MTLDRKTEEFLLGRRLREGVSPAVKRAFAGSRVLVTGAGGSVGSALARQLATCCPAEIVLVDHAEYLLFTAARRLQEARPDLRVHPVLADVSRQRDIATACRLHSPDFVFHAAACKHVTVAEEHVVQAARTNVLGAVFTARAAREAGARFVLISTDKAAEPHSVMGATKRLAEMGVLNGGAGAGALAVRFGNVLGSTGSVVEILMESVRAGRPVTITDPAATRYFMSAGEAVSLVLKAAATGRGGEVFWLDMGEPLRLMDLVHRVVQVARPQVSPAPRIVVVGLRPGEKRHEQLTGRDLTMERTADPAIWRARAHASSGGLRRGTLAILRRACASGDAPGVLSLLEDAVAGYTASPAAHAAAARAAGAGPRPRRGRSSRPAGAMRLACPA